MKLVSRAVLALLFFFVSIYALADNAGVIRGTVRDPMGAVVANARVELLRDGKVVAATGSSQSGAYQFFSLPSGHYQVRAAALPMVATASALTYVRSGEATTLDLTMKIGPVSQNIVVSATGVQVPESQVGASVSVITSDQFQNKLEALEPLRQIPGVQVLTSGQRGINESLFIRGGNSNANKILLDGIPVNEIGGAVDFGNLFTTGLDRMEVLRGPNSVLYGDDALAGVVNLTTGRGSTHLPLLSYSLDGGNFNTLHQAGSLGGIFRQFDYFSEFSRFDTSNAEPNSTFHNATYAGNFGWTPLATADLRLTVRRTVATTGVPNAINFFGIADDSFQNQHNTYISATGQHQTTSHWHNLLRYGTARINSEFENPTPTGTPFDPFPGFDSGPNFLGNTVTIRGANGFSTTGQAILDFAGSYPQQTFIVTSRDFVDFQSDYTFSSRLTGLFGFQYENERVRPIARNNFNYTGELHANWKHLYATLGGGVEDNAVFGVVPTPRASLAYYLFPLKTGSRLNGIKLKFNYGQGIKEADLFSEAFSLFQVLQQLPNGAQLISQFHVRPILPERSRSLDFGAEQFAFNGKLRLGATFFYNRYTDQIESVSSSGLLQLGASPALVADAPFGAFVNSLATRALGAETELELNLSHGFSARAAYTYLDDVVQRSFSSDELAPSFNPAFPAIPIGAFSPLVGNRPFDRAPHVASFHLGYTRPKFTLALSGNYVSRRDGSTFLSDAFFGTTMLLPNRNLSPSYFKMDLSGNFHLNRHVELYSLVENLADQHYDAVLGFPSLPLTFRSGVKLTLGGEGWK